MRILLTDRARCMDEIGGVGGWGGGEHMPFIDWTCSCSDMRDREC